MISDFIPKKISTSLTYYLKLMLNSDFMLSLGLTYNLNQINIFVRQNRKSTPIKSIDLTSLKNVHCMICRMDYH